LGANDRLGGRRSLRSGVRLRGIGGTAARLPNNGGKATGVDADTARKNVVASIGGFATGRFTTPEEVANLVVFLASERAGNVTGANYIVDGGLIKTL
jgi:NAD(P)-dependent dehydrogenase (short-subunit alcohol dehydrogenase family)